MPYRLWLAYASLLAVLAAPVLFSAVPVGVDTLNHLARLHVRAHAATDPDLARLFEVRGTLIPYLGMDWLLTPLVRIMPTLWVGRLATVACVWGVVGAVVALQRAFLGRIGPEPLAAGVIAWNGLTAWGFLNYLLGLAFALTALALWHGLRDRQIWARLAMFGAVTAGLYVTHLLALVLYGGLVGLYELTVRREWRWQAWAATGVQFSPAALLWFLSAPPLPLGSLGVLYNLPAAIISFASPTLFPGALGGLESGHLVLLAAIVLLVAMRRAGVVAWDRRLLGMAAVFCLFGIALPVAAVGISWINIRIPLVAACLACAAIRFTGAPAWGRAVAGLVLIRAASVSATMAACAPHYDELRHAMAALPRGVVLEPVLQRDAPIVSCSRLPVYEHMANLVTLERSGLSTDFFAQTTSVGSRGTITDRKAVELEETSPADLAPYVLWMHLGRPSPLPKGAVVLAAGSFFDLLRIASR